MSLMMGSSAKPIPNNLKTGESNTINQLSENKKQKKTSPSL